VSLYIVDASVATRFLISEDLHSEAEAFLRGFAEDRYDLAAPSLIDYEVGNALRTEVNRGNLPGEASETLYRGYLLLKMGRESLAPRDLQQALRLSQSRPISFYDAAYVWLSKKHGAPLITADDKQFMIASEEASVIHLRDVPSLLL